MDLTRAFHAGSTGSNPVRGTTESPAYKQVFRDGSELAAITSPSSSEEPSHSHVSRALGIAAITIMLLLGWTSAADARPITAGCGRHADVVDRRACIIRRVFGPVHGSKAVDVAWCESRLDPRARNGQYRGVFQMGSSERARFGHGRTVFAQARAAKRYHQISGWSPWTCA
jgi:hypothetical protein